MGDAFRIEIDLPAPPDRLWRYLTDANALATWYWPRQLEPTYESDPVLGGYFRIASQKAGVGVQGYYLEAKAPNRFVKTWSWDNEDSETQVEVQLQETEPGRTRLNLVHSGHDSPVALENHRTGWNDCLARLQERLERVASADISNEQDILDVVGAAMEHGYRILSDAELSPEFFDLGTGLMGELFQKFTNYHLQLAIVLEDTGRHGKSFSELVHEHERHASLRFFRTESEARDWIEQTAQLS